MAMRAAFFSDIFFRSNFSISLSPRSVVENQTGASGDTADLERVLWVNVPWFFDLQVTIHEPCKIFDKTIEAITEVRTAPHDTPVAYSSDPCWHQPDCR